MSQQFSVAARNSSLDGYESGIGTSPILKLRTGTLPADCATADTGSVLVSMTLPSDWMANAASGSKAKSGTWSGTASGTGVATQFRIYDSGGTTCHIQGTAGISVVIATSALTAANGNVLTFAATTGVVTGMNVAGTGVLAGSTVIAVTGTTVTLSKSSTAGVASAASITFSYDLVLDNSNIVSGQVVSVGTYQWTDSNG